MQSLESGKKTIKINITKQQIFLFKFGVVISIVFAVAFALGMYASGVTKNRIPGNFSKYIGSTYSIGFPMYWQIQTVNESFQARSTSSEEMDFSDSIEITTTDSKNLSKANFANKEDCDLLINNDLGMTSNTILESKFYRKADRNICEITMDVVTQSSTPKKSKMYIIQYNSDKILMLTGTWVKGSVSEDDIIKSLNSFKLAQ